MLHFYSNLYHILLWTWNLSMLFWFYIFDCVHNALSAFILCSPTPVNETSWGWRHRSQDVLLAGKSVDSWCQRQLYFPISHNMKPSHPRIPVCFLYTFSFFVFSGRLRFLWNLSKYDCIRKIIYTLLFLTLNEFLFFNSYYVLCIFVFIDLFIVTVSRAPNPGRQVFSSM